jgi:glutaredoxin 3
MENVKVYTMKLCPYCDRAKQLLTQRGIAFSEIVVLREDQAQWEALYKISGMRTMPQIFHGERLIGGYQQLAEQDQKDHLASIKS